MDQEPQNAFKTVLNFHQLPKSLPWLILCSTTLHIIQTTGLPVSAHAHHLSPGAIQREFWHMLQLGIIPAPGLYPCTWFQRRLLETGDSVETIVCSTTVPYQIDIPSRFKISRHLCMVPRYLADRMCLPSDTSRTKRHCCDHIV